MPADLVAKTDGIDLASAAALPLAGLTALQAGHLYVWPADHIDTSVFDQLTISTPFGLAS